jgi:hypothetical protein
MLLLLCMRGVEREVSSATGVNCVSLWPYWHWPYWQWWRVQWPVARQWPVVPA